METMLANGHVDSKLAKHFLLHDQTIQHVLETLEREICSILIKSTNMEEHVHKNTLQFTQEFLQHKFGDTPRITNVGG